MANGHTERVEVRVAVENADKAVFGSVSNGEASLRPVEPVPPVCSRHGDPEVERVRVTISAKSVPDDGGAGRLGSALAAAYRVQVAAVDWPVCARCVSTRIRWQIAAAVTCTAFALAFLALTFAVIQGAPRAYGIALLVVFAASFVPMYLALRMLEHRRTAVGVSVSDDGTELVVDDAHPTFAAAVSSQRP